MINFVSMKRVLPILILFVLLAASFTSCDNSMTYAEQLKDEKQSIKDYIQTKNIQVVDTIPTVVPWPNGVYFKTESGLYVRVLDTGDLVQTDIPENTFFTVRYNEKYLDGDDHFSNMNSSGDPIELIYGKVGSTSSYADCVAWHEGLDFVGKNGHIEMIVPASIGWSVYTTTSSLTAMYYEMRYSFWE